MPDIPAIRITAVDQASQVFDNVGKKLGGLAAQVISAAAVFDSMRRSIALADELKSMADATGLSVSRLDELSIIAKLNSADLGDMAKSFKFLGASMIEAQNATSRSGQLFQALGISVKDAQGNLRGVDEVMGEVAAALNDIENETTRAAVGNEIFGKSYQQIAAALRNYIPDQKAANELIKQYGAVSVEAANLADELGDKFTLLGEGSKRALLGGLVPGMRAALAGLNELTKSGGDFQRGFGDVISKVVEVVADQLLALKGVFQIVGVSIGAVIASITTRSLEPLREARADIAKIIDETNRARAEVARAAVGLSPDDARAIARAEEAQKRLNQSKADSAKLAAILAQSNKQEAQSIVDYAVEIEKLQDQIEELAGDGGGYKHFSAALRQVEKDLRDGKDVTNQAIDAFLAANKALDEQEARTKAATYAQVQFEKALGDVDKATEQLNAEVPRLNDALWAQNDALKVEIATLGLSNTERDIYIVKMRIAAEEARGNAMGVRLLVEQLQLLEERNAGQAALEWGRTWQQAIDDVGRAAGDWVVDFAHNGKDAFKGMWQSFRDWALRALAEIAAKQVVVSIVGALGMGGAGQAGANGFLGTASNAGGLLNIGSNLAGGAASIFGPSSFTAGLAGDAFMPGAFISGGTVEGAQAAVLGGELGAGAAGLGAVAGGAGVGYLIGSLGANYFGNGRNESGITWGATAGAAIGTAVFPVVGTLVGAIIGGIVGSFVKSGGGAKQGGSASIGDLSSTGLISAITPGRFGEDATINQADQQLQTTVKSIEESYRALIKNFGGQVADAAAFGLAFDTDPKGTAPNRVKAGVAIGGSSVYAIDTGEGDGNLGRDSAVLEARLQTEAKRMVLAALQASELPSYLGNLFDGLDASTATAEQIDNVVAAATAIKHAVELVPQLDASLANLQAEDVLGLIDAFGGLDALSQSMQAFAQNFLTSAERAAQAQQRLEESFSDLGLAVPETHEAFRQLLDSFDLTTENGRRLYAAVMNLGSSFVAVRGTADQVAQALKQSFAEVQSLAQSIKIGSSAPKIGAGSSSLALETQLAIDKASRDSLVSQFASDKPWATQYLAQVGGAGGFVQNLAGITEEDFGNYSAQDQALIKRIFQSQQALNATQEAVAAAYESAASAVGSGGGKVGKGVDPEAKERDAANQALAFYKQMSELSTGNYGRELALQIQFVSGALKTATSAQVPIYQAAAKDLQSSLALFNSLKGSYGDAMAGQLVQLSESYRQQVAQLGGNVQGLDAAQQIFEEQWTAIINGTAEGVRGTLDQLKKLQQGILEYVDSLKIGDLSTLTPQEKLTEARRQYETDVAGGRSGDLEALGDVTRSADAYLKLAREYLTSSPAYGDIFNQVTSALTELGTSTNLAPGVSVDDALLSVLPTNGKLISASDLWDVAAFLANTPGAIGAALPSLTAAPSTSGNTAAAVKADNSDVLERLEAILEALVANSSITQSAAEVMRTALDRNASVIKDAITYGTR